MAENETAKAGGVPDWLRPWIHWRYWRFRALLALLIYTLAGFFLAPWLVERTVVSHMADIDRTATIGELRMNPFLLTTDMQQFALADKDGRELVSFGRLFIDLQTRSIIDFAAKFQLIRIDSLRVFDERFEGADTRMVRLMEDLLPPEDPEAEDEPPPRAIVQRLEISDARLDFIDGPADNFQGRVGPVSVEVEDIRTLPDHSGRQSVFVQINETDHVSWQGDLQLVPFRSSGQVQLRGRELPNTRELLDYYLPFDLLFRGISADFVYETWVDEDGLGLELREFNGGVSQMELQTDDDNESLVSLERIDASGGRFDLRAWSGHVERVDVQGFGANVVLREDGSLNLLDLLPDMPTDDVMPADEPPLALSLAQLTVSGDAIEIQERSFDPPLQTGLRGLALSLNGIDLEDGTVMPLDVSFDLSTGGSIGFDGGVTAFPELRANGRVDVSGLALSVAQPVIDSIARVRLDSGTLDLSADATHGPEQLLALGGELAVNDLSVEDSIRSERLAAWERLELDRFEVDLAANRVGTSELVFTGLYGRVHIAEDRSTNVGDLLIEGDPSAESTPLPEVTVGGIRMTGTALDFSDFSLPLPFEAAIRDMDGEISTLSTASSEPATVALEGQVNEFGLARINGSVNAWDPTRQTDIQMQFRNLEISRLTPYTVQFAGYAIEDGRLEMDLGYRLDERKLQGDNSIVIREMQLGEKVDHPDAGNLPLGLAVALLKDSEGVIDLDVPVEGDLDNPEFRIGGVVLRALGNLITKVVTAPFRLLGNLVGIDSEDFGVLSFQPGDAELSPPDREQLLKLTEAMAQRPELTLEVSGTWSPEIDEPALKEAFLNERIEAWQAANPGDDDELTTDRDRRTLEALFAETFPTESLEAIALAQSASPADDPEGDAVLDELAYAGELRTRLLASTSVSQSDFEALASARSAAVLAALTNESGALPENVREGAPAQVEADDNEDVDRGAVPLELGVAADG